MSSERAERRVATTLRWTVPPEEEALRLDVVVPLHVEDASRAQAKKWIEGGWVRVEGRPARPSRAVRAGEIVEVRLPPLEPAEPRPEPIPLSVVYEDDDLLVVDKPPMLVVHPAPGHPSGTLVNALLYHCPRLSGVGGVARPGIVHRLDRGTSGLLVVAKHDRAHRRLAEQFAARTVDKRYLALVHGLAPETLHVDRPLGRHVRDRKRISSRTRRGREATTEARRIETFPGASLLDVHIRTGRTHQIRVHLAESGHAVVGDPDYGHRPRPSGRGASRAARILARVDRPALHAAVLAFDHPASGARLRFEAPLPSDLASVLEELRALRSELESSS